MTLVRLALRNLSRNRRRTAISLAALMICVAAMVALRGFINGQQEVILTNFIDGQIGALQVHRKGYLANVQGSPLDLDLADSPALREKLAAVEGVRAISPRIVFGGMISSPDAAIEGRVLTEDEIGKTSFLMITAFDPALERPVSPKRWDTWLGAGSFYDSADAQEVVLNADFTRSIGAQVWPRDRPRPPENRWLALLAADRDGALNGENVLVAGTLLSATPGDRKVGYAPLATAQRLLRMEGRVTEYAIAVHDTSKVAQVQERLRAALGEGYEVHTWDEVFPFVKDLLGSQDFVFGAITNVFLLVVLLGIVNVMLMNVLERIREIGTMMAVGVRRRQIVTLFLLEGGTLGLLGGLLGSALGGALVILLYRRGIFLPAPGSTVDAIIRPFVGASFMLRTLLFASVGSALAAIYPAYRASKLRPVEALAST